MYLLLLHFHKIKSKTSMNRLIVIHHGLLQLCFSKAATDVMTIHRLWAQLDSRQDECNKRT